MATLKPVTPGELLLEEFLKPMNLSQYRLAKEIGVPPQRIGEIIAGRRAITALRRFVPCAREPAVVQYRNSGWPAPPSASAAGGRAGRRRCPMPVKAHTEWTLEELWRQEQVNFSAHMAIMFHYLEKHRLPLDDFIWFIGESVLPSWRGRGESVPDVMNGILFNARANGAAIRDVSVTEACAVATVSSILRPDVMERYGIAPEVAGRLWDKFIPIASAFGLRFTRTRTADGQDRIRLEKL